MICVSLIKFKFGTCYCKVLCTVMYQDSKRLCSFQWLRHFAKVIFRGIRKLYSWPVGEIVFLEVILGKVKRLDCIECSLYARHCVRHCPMLPCLNAHSTGRQAHHSPWQLRWLVPDHLATGTELLQVQVICPQAHLFSSSLTLLIAMALFSLFLTLLLGGVVWKWCFFLFSSLSLWSFKSFMQLPYPYWCTE